jgi:C1A family cysteine protease
MAICPFAIWRVISGPSGAHIGGPFKIVHHTTEGSSADGAFSAFKQNRSDPHFTVDAKNIYQHIDTSQGARALRNAPGGTETNRDSAVQIELVGFAQQAKNPKALQNLARLCRWIESVHGIPRVWPAGLPKPAKNGKDPGGHNRDFHLWDTQSGHYGHSQVPENTHWDPAYSAAEANFVLQAEFDANGNLTSGSLPAMAAKPDTASKSLKSAMPDHHHVESDQDAPDKPMPPKPRSVQAASGRKFKTRRDTLDFRDRMFVPTLVEVPSNIPLSDYLKFKVPVLDQGVEGSCTGFGLATVANYLLMRRQQVPDSTQVSARMFYELARRYDEWPGVQYSGSSARGAMKGWQKHGVCSREDWDYNSNDAVTYADFTQARMEAARQRPLGAYFRVNHKDLIAMHAAIAEVGVLYATATVHAGWQTVGENGIIYPSDEILGGHAFAIVGYDRYGFWLQNSWGEDWGRGGMARVSYDDWLSNATDVWVARLGAPVVLNDPASYAAAHASTSGQSATYSYIDIRPHLISVGNDGVLDSGGDYGTSASEVANIFAQDIPAFFASSKQPQRVLLYFHGGLVAAEAAVQRVAEYRPALVAAGIYPLAFIWHSDYWSTITNILQDAVRRRRPEGVLDKAKDFMLDRFDDALEPLARQLTGKASWDEMKENALRASGKGGAARLVVDHLQKLAKAYPRLEVHVVNHSAGSIFFAPMLALLGKAGISVTSCTMWAPACTAALFKQTYLPAIESGQIKRFALYCLTDKAEQDDNCARIYNKSLLYLVSNAFEDKAHIPGYQNGIAIVGMQKTIKEDPALKKLFGKKNAELVLCPNNEPDDSASASKAEHHGDFDDDHLTVKSTFARIAAKAEVPSLTFAPSASSLTRKRMDIDLQTRK